MPQLDSDLLRTFLAVAEAGSITGGAARIHRSQSAASLQIRQLEHVLGRPVLLRHGRGVALTAAGERLLPVARQVTGTLDAALAALRPDALAGRLRIGLPDDYGRTTLARIVADFARAHPRVELSVQCALGTGFARALRAGTLDMAVHEVPAPPPDAQVLRSDRIMWMASRDHDAARRDPLPVAVFDRDCWWRDAALASLEDSGRRYRVVFTSESAVGVWAAIESGMAVGLLRETPREDTFVALPELAPPRVSHLVLQSAPALRGPVSEAMRAAIRRGFHASPPEA